MLPKSTTSRTWRKLLAIFVTLLLMPFGLALALPPGVPLPPTKPGNVTAAYVDDQQVELIWIDTSVNERAFGLRYKVKGGEWTYIKSIPSSSIGQSGKKYTIQHDVPNPGVIYCYQVNAVNLGGVGSSKESCSGDGQRQLVPSYFYPDLRPDTDPNLPNNQWPIMCEAMDKEVGGSIAVLNPYSGPNPGAPADPNYVEVVTNCREAGHKVIGYISTDWGRKSARAVKDEINDYYAKYTVDGIFFDEMANEKTENGRDNVAHYAGLYQYVHAKDLGAIVVGNPGSAAEDEWQMSTPAADIVVVFEGPFEDIVKDTPEGPVVTAVGYKDWDPPAWALKKEYFGRLSHMVYATPASDRQTVCKKSRASYAGFIYVTDDFVEVPDPTDDDEEDQNQWNELPSYWDQVAPVCKGE